MPSIAGRENDKSDQEDYRVNFLDLLLVVSRHIRLVFFVSLAVLLIAIVFYKREKTIFVSSSKLMVLEYVEHTKALVGESNCLLVVKKRSGHWKPAEVFGLKELLNSSKLRDGMRKKLHLSEDAEYQLMASVVDSNGSDGTIGVIDVQVKSRDRESVQKIATASIEEAGRLAFLLDFISLPTPVTDNMPDKSGNATMVMYLLEAPSQATEIRPSMVKKIVLPTLMGTLFSLLMAFLMDFFQNLNYEDRRRVVMIKTALLGKKNTDTFSEK